MPAARFTSMLPEEYHWVPALRAPRSKSKTTSQSVVLDGSPEPVHLRITALWEELESILIYCLNSFRVIFSSILMALASELYKDVSQALAVLPTVNSSGCACALIQKPQAPKKAHNTIDHKNDFLFLSNIPACLSKKNATNLIKSPWLLLNNYLLYFISILKDSIDFGKLNPKN